MSFLNLVVSQLLSNTNFSVPCRSDWIIFAAGRTKSRVLPGFLLGWDIAATEGKKLVK